MTMPQDAIPDFVKTDRIFLHDYVVSTEIGAFQQEHGNTQRVRFTIDVDVLPLDAGLDDDVDKILSYDTLLDAIHAELNGGRINLLETLAERLASRVLARPAARAVAIRIEKLDKGPFVLGVDITRTKADLSEAVLDTLPPEPTIVVLPAEKPEHAAELGKRLVENAQERGPVVFVAGVQLAATQLTGDGRADQHIALLLMEQAAWAIAAGQEALSVVATRTEIDWALVNGKPCLWAPSKLVHGASLAIDPKQDPAPQIVPWLADALRAKQVISLKEFCDAE